MTVFLSLITMIKLLVARFLPLLGDEAYYNIWSKHLAPGYVDHPPMIAYINWFINHTFGQTETGVRLGAIICLLISTWLIYLTAKEAFGKKVGIASAILFNLIPTYFAGGLFLTPEQPFIIFWLLSLYFSVKIIKTQKAFWWYLLGASVGLGLLSKFPMLLFLAGIFLFLLLSDKNRRWFSKKEPYLAFIILLLVASPLIAWNIQQGFPSLVHHGARIGSPHYVENVIYFLALQFVMFSPPLFLFTCTVFFYELFKRRLIMDDLTLFFSTVSFPAFLAFLLVSPLTLVGGHWTSTVYLGLIIIACQRLLALTPNPLRSLRVWTNILIIASINILFIGYYAFLYPAPEALKNREYTVNRELPLYIKGTAVDYVFSDQMGVASLAAFYGDTKVYLPKGFWKQFDIWGRPELKPGDSILYFSFDRPDLFEKLKPLFKKVEVEPNIRLFAKDSNIPEKTKIYICRDFKGGKLP